ncbi:hypothetical protein HJC23_001316 [Cyclotella cryptica]|uniref:ATP-dependent transporter ycf16 n=1 Tax=Cyclotella cryptica TaxID=29204 RepID=A0ABD3NXH7_9STRA
MMKSASSQISCHFYHTSVASFHQLASSPNLTSMIMASTDNPTIPTSVESSTRSKEKHRPNLEHQPPSRTLQVHESIFKLYSDARADAFPLSRAANRNEFMSYFSWGDPDRDPQQTQTAKVSLSTMLSFSTPKEKALMSVGILMATIAGFGIPVWLILLARALDAFSNMAVVIEISGGTNSLMDELRQELNKLCIGFAVVGLISLVCGFAYVSLWTYTGEQQALRIQKEFVRACLNQDAAWFDKNDRDTLPTKMGTSLMHISNAIGRQVADVYANGISSAGCLAVSLLLNTPLALIMLCAVPIAFIILALFNTCIRRVKKRSASEMASAGGIATEVLAGIKTVSSLCAQQHFKEKYESHVNASAKFSIRATVLSSLLAGITGALFYITYTVAFVVGTEQVISGMSMPVIIQCYLSSQPNCRVTGAAVMCCIYGVILCVTYFGLMGPGLSVINLGRSAAVDVFDTLLRHPAIDPSSKDGKKLDFFEGFIEFRRVFFSYVNNQNKPIFQDFNLKINAGQSIALVGPSGSGKSTIARLLLRFYDPNAGEIIVDGKSPITSFNVSWWRRQIGYVAQEPILFPGTIRENIALGNFSENAVTFEEVINAAKLACAHEFIIDLPSGYDTVYEGTSVQLSGGQMQRIAIARALLRNPRILILDEGELVSIYTSNTYSSLKFLRNSRKFRVPHILQKKKITTITIAHRLTTIIDSNVIAVINNGSIAELGDHGTLYRKENGIYRSLCESQGIKASNGAEQIPSPLDSSLDDGTLRVSYPFRNVEASSPIAEGELIPNKAVDPEHDTSGPDEYEEVDVPTARMSTVWSYLGADVLYATMGIIGSGGVGALSPCESILTAQIVTNFYVVPTDDMLEVNLKYIYKFLYFALASLIANLMVGIGLSRSGSNLGKKLRNIAFSAMLERSIGWFDDAENTTGELTKILSADAEAVESLTGLPLGFRIRVLASILTGVCVALAYSLQIGLVAIACIPIIMAAGLLQVCCAKRKFRSNNKGASPPTIMEQGLRGISSVQAYNLESKVGDDYEKALMPECADKVKTGMIAGFVFGFSQFAIFLSFAVIFYVGTEMLVNMELYFADFFTALLSVMFGALGASQVSADFNNRARGMISAARIFSVLDGPSDGTGDDEGAIVPINGNLEFTSVQFAFPSRPNRMVYTEMSLDVAQGESIGLVGRSGSGKSTILQILLRFYEITGGSAKLDGKELSSFNVNNLRRQIGYVGQLPVLFNGSVRYNILLGNPNATEDEIISAAKAANAHEFIMNLPQGYDSEVGPGGSMLSGGQKQRIAIARGIIRDPKILVLDEATAALDNESQKLVQLALDEIQDAQPRTTLTVAHRLLTVKHCNKIAFLGDGRVLEIGTHAELLAMKGHYYNLWCMQGSEQEQT